MMFLRQIIAIFFLLFLTSCDLFSPGKRLPGQTLIQTEVDFNSVDVYPLFRACNNCDANEKQNLCFENVLVNNLEKILNKKKPKARKDITGAVFIDLRITKTGKISIIKINTDPEIRAAIPELDAILKAGVAKLPEIIQPALKRGIPVEVQFKLQINLVREED